MSSTGLFTNQYVKNLMVKIFICRKESSIKRPIVVFILRFYIYGKQTLVYVHFPKEAYLFTLDSTTLHWTQQLLDFSLH